MLPADGDLAPVGVDQGLLQPPRGQRRLRHTRELRVRRVAAEVVLLYLHLGTARGTWQLPVTSPAHTAWRTAAPAPPPPPCRWSCRCTSSASAACPTRGGCTCTRVVSPGPRVHVSPVHAVRGPHQVAPPHRHGVPAGLGDARRLGRVVRVVEQLTNHSSALQLHQSGLTWPRM